jgi:hypothetical protein
MSQAQEAEEKRQISALAAEQTDAVMTEMRRMAHFTKENEPAINKRFAAIPMEVKQAHGTIAALYLAYIQFLNEDILPKIKADAVREADADNRRRANAGAGNVRPGGGTNVGGKAPTNPRELAEHMRRMQAGA